MKLAIALLALISASASAGTLFDENGNKIDVCKGSTCGGNDTPSTPQVTTINVNQNGKSISRASARSTSNSSATANAVGTVKQSVTVQAAQAAKIPDNTPDIGLAVPPATSPCRIAVGAGGSGPGLGLMLGFSTLDEGCDTREDVRTLWAVGLQGAAYARLCQKPEMAKAMGAMCADVKKEDVAGPAIAGGFKH